MRVNRYRQAVEDLFRSKPNVWIHWTEIAACGGALAWRTRVSDARATLGVIENQQRKDARHVTHSYYRYVPAEPSQASLFGKGAAA
jgi:hypothetical protein